MSALRPIALLATLAVGCDAPASDLRTTIDQSPDASLVTADAPSCPGPGWIAGTVTGDIDGVAVAVGVPYIVPGDTEYTDYKLVTTLVPDASGHYAFNGSSGDYGVWLTVVDPDQWRLTSASPRQYATASASSCVELNFFAQTEASREVSGTLTIGGPVPLPSVGFSGLGAVLPGPYTRRLFPGTVVTASATQYQAPYTNEPYVSGYSLKPQSWTVPAGTAPLTGVDFVMSPDPHVISGNVSGVEPSVQPPDYTLHLSDGRHVAPQRWDSTSNRYYAFGAVADGTYTLSMEPRLDVVSTPASRQVTVSGGDVGNQDFVITPSPYSISGTLDCGGPGEWVFLLVIVTGNGLEEHGGPQSNTNQYEFRVPDGTFTVTPVNYAVEFDPPSREVIVSGGNVTGVDFTCTFL